MKDTLTIFKTFPVSINNKYQKMNMQKPRVFLSHSSVDKPRVRLVKTVLENNDIDCWFDEDEILPGHSIFSSVQQGLKKADFVIFFISEASVDSTWVELEIASSIVTQLKGRSPRVIPAKLDDVPSPELLQDIVWADLSDKLSIEGANILARTIKSHFETINQIPKEQSTDDLPIELSALKGIPAHPKFHLFLISGASSSGKDVLSHLLDQKLSIEYDLDIATKFTTRPRRNTEPTNIQSISHNEFQKQEQKSNIIFPYSKRSHLYGFDAKQVRRAVSVGYPLVSIFTHLRKVPEISRLMNNNGYPTTPIFIDVPRKHLMRRVPFRNFDESELRERIRSIDKDLNELSTRSTFKNEYIFIKNGDEVALEDSSEILKNTITQILTKQASKIAINS